jgi:uncharacterized protein (DUF1499 family)
MRLPVLGPILLLLAGCTVPSHTRAVPTEPEFRALMDRGNGSNIAVTSDSADDARLRTRFLKTTVAGTRAILLRAVQTMPRWKVVDSSGSVLWITRTTRIFRFVDDLYVLIEARGSESAILVRSASRIGKGDLGQNRRNIAELWTALGIEHPLRPISSSNAP